jgi:hypothetical protein
MLIASRTTSTVNIHLHVLRGCPYFPLKGSGQSYIVRGIHNDHTVLLAHSEFYGTQ